MEAGKPVTYSGQGFSLLGEKGRFVLPPDFRKAVRDSGIGAAIGVMMAAIVVVVFALTNVLVKNDDVEL